MTLTIAGVHEPQVTYSYDMPTSCSVSLRMGRPQPRISLATRRAGFIPSLFPTVSL